MRGAGGNLHTVRIPSGHPGRRQFQRPTADPLARRRRPGRRWRSLPSRANYVGGIPFIAPPDTARHHCPWRSLVRPTTPKVCPSSGRPARPGLLQCAHRRRGTFSNLWIHDLPVHRCRHRTAPIQPRPECCRAADPSSVSNSHSNENGDASPSLPTHGDRKGAYTAAIAAAKGEG